MLYVVYCFIFQRRLSLIILLIQGKDLCGVCGGDSSTCEDCEGVPNGGKVEDICGNCKHPKTDDTFDKGCGPQLGNFKPTVGYVGALDVMVDAANLPTDGSSAVKCTFNEYAYFLTFKNLLSAVKSF